MSDLKRRDFMSDQAIRWCPGCGDYSILAQLQSAMAIIGRPQHEHAVISGIGCSSRLPYYMSTYGFHTIHGRAPAVATGLKLAHPELAVWVITGDGDALSIGGNHLAHVLRRNVGLNILLFNNRIYGLTKGQYSPTSEVGKRTKSSPMGSVDAPMNPAAFALGSGASYVARSVDVLPRHLRDALVAANAHAGTSFLEILQNCNIFNDGAFDEFTAKDARNDRILYLETGAPMVWGESARWGLRQKGMGIEIVQLAESDDGSTCLHHDPTDRNQAWALAHLIGPGAPMLLGVLFEESRPTYEVGVRDQIVDAQGGLEAADIHRLLQTPDAFTIR